MPINTANKFLVASNSQGIVIMTDPRKLTYDDALLLAAYLVSMAEPFASYKFPDVLEAVQGS